VDTQLVKTGKNIRIYVPNVFTPNGDTKNDYLRPWLLSIQRVNYFKVYNRWGKLIFEMAGDRPGWDGRINGQPAEPQTVVWMIEAVDVDGIVHRQQGTTVLIR
jgi:gliding motility-associated-like protein